MITVIRSAISTGTAGCRSAMLAVRIITPGTIAHAVAGVFVIRIAAVPAIGFAPVLTGRILLPRAIAIVVSACIDGFALGLTAGAGIRPVTVAGTGGCLLALQYPCMAAAVRTSTGTVGTGSVTLGGVCPQILDIMTAIAFIIVGMTTRGMGNFNVCALERILSARRAVADNRSGRSDGNARRTHGSTDC